MSKTLFKNDDLILRDDAIGKLKTSDNLSRAAEKLKRDPRLDEAFLLHPENHRILQGKGVQPFNYNWLMLGFSLVSLVLLLFVLAFAVQSGLLMSAGSAFALIALVFVGITGVSLTLFAFLSVKLIRDDRDFAQNGVLLVGSLSSIGGEWKRSTGKNRPPQYKVTVAYTVELPDGKVITETAWANRRDLEDFKARPKQGTPVAVQYSPKSKKIRLL
jgi:hypothetical protein